nr:MAG TPA: EB1-like C-terminal motif [Caudoviricetes sp.]
MTTQEKVLYIIELLELSDRQVSAAIGKALSTTTHKRLQVGRNKFTDEDLNNLKNYYIDKLRQIEELQ